MQIKETEITRILNPTAIDLGDYVINPYLGCEFGCLYCYVRFNKVAARKPEPWGSYVEVRKNCAMLLEKEIKQKRPSCVLLGSTTDCFQPIEKKYGLTKKILEILNENKVYYSILTRSPLISEYVYLLKKGFCKKIYFTINDLAANIKEKLEPKSPNYEDRIKSINFLLENNVDVIPYFSPIIPWVSNTQRVFSFFPKAETIEFEGLNFRLGNIKQIIDIIALSFPNLGNSCERLINDKIFYEAFWLSVKKNISSEAEKIKKRFNIYIHKPAGFFENSYLSIAQ